MRHQVGLILGEPSDTAALDPSSIQTIWKYGNVEFHFNKNVLTQIHADTGDLFYGGQSLIIESDGFSAGMAPDDAKQLLESSGVRYKTTDGVNSPEMEIAVDSGFRFGFVLDADAGIGETGLCSWPSQTPDNNTLHTEPRAARLLETMIFAAAR